MANLLQCTASPAGHAGRPGRGVCLSLGGCHVTKGTFLTSERLIIDRVRGKSSLHHIRKRAMRYIALMLAVVTITTSVFAEVEKGVDPTKRPRNAGAKHLQDRLAEAERLSIQRQATDVGWPGLGLPSLEIRPTNWANSDIPLEQTMAVLRRTDAGQRIPFCIRPGRLRVYLRPGENGQAKA